MTRLFQAAINRMVASGYTAPNARTDCCVRCKHSTVNAWDGTLNCAIMKTRVNSMGRCDLLEIEEKSQKSA